MGVDEAGVLSRGWVAVATLAVVLCALVFPAIAGAAEMFVDSNGDEVDAALGTGGCLTAAGKCTLRAAIEESNFSVGERDEILFDEGVFDAGPGSTIVLGSSLPTVVDSMHIIGHECSTPAGVGGPCVEIHGSSGAPAVIVKDTEEVVIEGVAVTGAEIGISVKGSSHFEAFRDWLGVKLDGSAAGNGIGILVGPGSNRSRIGPGEGNLFANNSEDGLDILGASEARVLSNVFGVKPGTAAPAANGTDIEVTSWAEGGFVKAEGTEIGARIDQDGVATPLCDRGCNVISGAGTDGIDLQGDGGEEAPAAVATTIAGNYIGLDPTGTVAVPNAASGIRVGEAAETVIGGPQPGDANRIDGGEVGVDAGPFASDLVVRSNRIGVDGAGTGSLIAPEEGIRVNSEGLLSPALEAVISDNEIRMEGGVGIAQNGFGAWISGNTITGGKTGIGTSGLTEEHGNRIEGNSIEGPGGNGILVENDLNEILGNQISLTGGAGILIQGPAPFGVNGNLVGGDTARDENVITGSGAAAIEVSNPESAENEVARNRGNANTGLFIDLVAASNGEPKGPNGGIQPPVISAATEGGASGSGAQAGATVRVFRKQVAAPGEVESFLGEAIADVGGNWSVGYGTAISAGTVVAATQTSEAGGTSELASALTGGGAPGGEGGGGPGKSGSGNRIPPRTTIVTGPKARSRSRSALFRFFSDELGSTFRCSLDGERFRPCRSPKGYGQLKPGKHLFRVRAVDPAGNVDPTPAKNRFTVE